MTQTHRIARLFVAFAAGALLAWYAYDRSTDPEPRRQRVAEEAAVLAARGILEDYVALGRELEIVDPLAPDRKVGKVYIYPTADGWQVSGHYRRAGEQRWHAWLMTLDAQEVLLSLSAQDDSAELSALAASDERFSAVP